MKLTHQNYKKTTQNKHIPSICCGNKLESASNGVSQLGRPVPTRQRASQQCPFFQCLACDEKLATLKKRWIGGNGDRREKKTEDFGQKLQG